MWATQELLEPHTEVLVCSFFCSFLSAEFPEAWPAAEAEAGSFRRAVFPSTPFSTGISLRVVVVFWLFFLFFLLDFFLDEEEPLGGGRDPEASAMARYVVMRNFKIGVITHLSKKVKGRSSTSEDERDGF